MYIYPTPETHWSQEQKVEAVMNAGFRAIGGGTDIENQASCEEHGLDYIGMIDANEQSLEGALRAIAKMNPKRVNVQLCDHDTPPAVALGVWLRMCELAKQLGIEIDLEMHRDTATETPEKTYEIADRFEQVTGEKIRLCLDFSHFAVNKHLNPPFASRLLERPELVQRARQIHLRPFNGHHAQVPATDGQGNHSREFEDIKIFMADLFACWFDGARGGERVYFCPEFGPPEHGYGLFCFPDRFQDMVVVKNEAERIWAETAQQWAQQLMPSA